MYTYSALTDWAAESPTVLVGLLSNEFTCPSFTSLYE